MNTVRILTLEKGIKGTPPAEGAFFQWFRSCILKKGLGEIGGLVKDIFRILRNMDWFYEFRPLFILIFGLVGVFNRDLGSNLMWIRVGQTCGLLLILIALKICQWRYQYRRNRSQS